MPTEAEIRRMDGPALTQLAYTLGLSPHHDGIPSEPSEEGWHPHRDLWQAYAVFHVLRTLEWSTTTHHYTPLGYGECRAFGHSYRIVVRYEGAAQTDEACALLRCACIAATSYQQRAAQP